MFMYNIKEFGEIMGSFLGGAFITAFFALGFLIAILLIAGVYIYHALAWSVIAKKLKHKYPWLAWIPFANISLILELGGFHWAWVFLLLIPIFGWLALIVLTIIATWKIFEKRNYYGWFSLAILIPKVGWIFYMIAIGFVAWKEQKKK